MHGRTTIATLLLGSLLMEGCARTPVEVGICGFERYGLAVEDPHSSFDPRAGERERKIADLAAGQPDLAARKRIISQFMAAVPLAIPSGQAMAQPNAAPEPKFQSGTLASVVSETIAARQPAQPRNKADTMLFMSGGGEHGAYGAGFLSQWQNDRTDRKLPDFAVVTGISTGAILATFAFVSRSDLAVAGYTIRNENELLAAYGHPPRGGGLSLRQGAALLLKGSVADLTPLRKHLGIYLDDDILTAVASEGEKGRRLLVGAVNVDTGQAEAFDLTDMAQRWAKAPAAPASKQAAGDQRGDTKPHLKQCYIAAIVASASAPVAAPPVFIDNREYMDGGARYGVFSDELGSVITQKSSEFSRRWAALSNDKSIRPPAEPAPVPIQYVIINGTLTIPPVCATGLDCDKSAATNDPATTGAQYGTAPHVKWSIIDLAQRTGEDILPNQVYRFSATQIEAQSETESNLFKFSKIGPDLGDFRINIDDPSSLNGQRSCNDYEISDKAGVIPVQFHPLYMRCVIEYGKWRAKTQIEHGNWDPTWQE